MRAHETIILLFFETLVDQHPRKLILGECQIAVTLRFPDQFLRARFSRLPVAQLNSVPDHLLLAGNAVTAILLVRFFECVERPIFVVLLSFELLRLAKGLLSFFVGRGAGNSKLLLRIR